MSSPSMCSGKMLQIKDVIGANTGRHLLLHLLSSVAHLIISLVLGFFWVNAICYGKNTGMAVMFGIMSLAYTILSAFQLGLAIKHFCFDAKSLKMLVVTMLGTSGGSALLAGVDLVVSGMLQTTQYCHQYDDTLVTCSFIFLGLSLALNALLFIIVLVHFRHQTELLGHICGPVSSNVWRAQSVQKKSPINDPFAVTVPKPVVAYQAAAPLYPSKDLGSIASFGSISELNGTAAQKRTSQY